MSMHLFNIFDDSLFFNNNHFTNTLTCLETNHRFFLKNADFSKTGKSFYAPSNFFLYVRYIL